MVESLFHRKAGLFGLIILLRATLPPISVVGVLYAVTLMYDIPFYDLLMNTGAIAFGLSVVLLQPARSLTAPPPSRNQLPVVFSVVLRWAIVFAILLALGFITKRSDYFPRRVVLTWAAITPCVLVIITLVLNEILRRAAHDPSNIRDAVVVGWNASSAALVERLKASPETSVRVMGFFDDRDAGRLEVAQGSAVLLGKLAELRDYVNAHRVQVIFISLPIRYIQRFVNLIDELCDTTASVYYVPNIVEFDLIQSQPREIAGVPVVAMCETPLAGPRMVVKRLMDICLSIVLLGITAPLLELIPIIIKITSPGPVMFRQRRYGLDGSEFLVYKFRTMTVTEDGGQVRQASKGDSRITRFGAFLRRYSLDELPQLLNVLQGRMSLVGPRPHAVAHNEQYRKLIKGYMLRHKVLPGITGLAQINGCRGETPRLEDMEARVKYDLDYLKHWSPALDLKILLRTALRSFTDEKAY